MLFSCVNLEAEKWVKVVSDYDLRRAAVFKNVPEKNSLFSAVRGFIAVKGVSVQKWFI